MEEDVRIERHIYSERRERMRKNERERENRGERNMWSGRLNHTHTDKENHFSLNCLRHFFLFQNRNIPNSIPELFPSLLSFLHVFPPRLSSPSLHAFHLLICFILYLTLHSFIISHHIIDWSIILYYIVSYDIITHHNTSHHIISLRSCHWTQSWHYSG